MVMTVLLFGYRTGAEEVMVERGDLSGFD